MTAHELHYPNVALVIEGGGTRNSYTAAVIDRFLAENIRFGWVGGISAGTSHTVNYLSGSRQRTREAFTDMPASAQAGGWGSFLRGRGYFNSEYIYETSTAPDQRFAIDFPAFQANPTPFRIGSVRADTGEMVYWGREDISTQQDLAQRVRASSTMPLIMPMPIIAGIPYVDGALGPTGGIPLDAAQADGFSTFLVLRSQPREYIKPTITRPQLIRRAFRRYPAIAEALIARPARYNRTQQELLSLEASGDAYMFSPKNMLVGNKERNLAKLQASFAAGETQTEEEWDAILNFLKASNR
ncbi:DUF6363 domain-containing protein [Corynebacterium sp. H128]|uniref:patatin-like phospholipase family protein n=1 Tax=unclassified Corynebacterium TaxID=2624378 RepID=UPI0030B2A002